MSRSLRMLGGGRRLAKSLSKAFSILFLKSLKGISRFLSMRIPAKATSTQSFYCDTPLYHRAIGQTSSELPPKLRLPREQVG